MYKNQTKKFIFNARFFKLDSYDLKILFLVVVLAGIVFTTLGKYHSLGESYDKSVQDYNNLLADRNNLANKLNEKDEKILQVNQNFAEVLEKVDAAAENYNLNEVKNALYLYNGNVGQIPVKIFANVDANVSSLLNDIEKMPYKEGLKGIKILNMQKNYTRHANGTEITFTIGGGYFGNPDYPNITYSTVPKIHFYTYDISVLMHEDCHHIYYYELNDDDKARVQQLYNLSGSDDFVTEYAKTDHYEDFAETCQFVVLDKTISNSTILQEKVKLIKKYV